MVVQAPLGPPDFHIPGRKTHTTQGILDWECYMGVAGDVGGSHCLGEPFKKGGDFGWELGCETVGCECRDNCETTKRDNPKIPMEVVDGNDEFLETNGIEVLQKFWDMTLDTLSKPCFNIRRLLLKEWRWTFPQAIGYRRKRMNKNHPYLTMLQL